MNKIGQKVLVKQGVFVGYKGTISGVFQYKGSDVYVIDMYRGKNITEKFITTASENGIEYIH